MDYFSTLSFLFPILLALAYTTIVSGRRKSQLPPGPFPLPIIGNLLHLSDNPHQSLATLAKRYGPLMSLRFGTRTSIVVSSPDIAKDFFQTHDHLFSGRPVPDSVRVVDHDNYSLVWLPTGNQWQRLRRISKEYLFSVRRLDASEHIRQQKVKDLLDYVNRCCESGKLVNIGGIAFTTSLNALSNLMFSMDTGQYDSVSSQEFRYAVCALLEVGGRPNVADFFPILKPFDPQGLRRHSKVFIKKIMNVIDGIIDQRLLARLGSSSNDSVALKNDVLDLLLNINQKDESEISRDDITHLFIISEVI